MSVTVNQLRAGTPTKFDVDSAGRPKALLGPDGYPALSVEGGNAGPGTLLVDWGTTGTVSLVSANGAPEAAAVDSSVTYEGYSSIKCTFKASSTFIANLAVTSAFTMSKMRTLQVPIYFTSNSAFVAGTNHISIWIYDSTLAKTLRAIVDTSTLTPNAWNVISLAAGASTEGWAFGTFTNTSDMDNETCPRVRIVVVTPAGTDNVNVWIGPITMNARRKGIVSLVMDGEYDSQKKYLLPMLDGYGLRSSLALVAGNVGSAGYMTLAQLQDAYANGHEMIHHTYSAAKTGGYANATDWPTQADIEADINAGYSYLTANGMSRGVGYAVHGHSYPFDQTVADARQAIVKAAYTATGTKAIRKSVSVYNRLHSIARPGSSFVCQGAVQVTSTHSSANIQTFIDYAESRGEWAIITIHRSVIDSATPAALEMTNANFNTWLSYLAGRARIGAVEVLPFGEAARKVFRL